ncbi:MAG: glycoside hydrolase family 3 C-terminal domain-containing protein [Spirochaetaceae bacterium]|nr:glycoside hydrolase family 3 C-terminal domain-containing protein [Spirochaetaceae bacterium]
MADLIASLQPDEKVALLMHESPAIPRLGIAAYDWWSECLHGVARAGVATVFPQAIALAATFDTGLVAEVYEAVAAEALYKHRLSGRRERYWGLTFCTPNVNIFRDPRWGRGHETFGEDPFLTGAMARATIRGLQGPDPAAPRVAACAKHFAVHSGPETLRHGFDVPVTPKDLQETYLPAFKASVDAGVAAVMPAYNAVDGVPCCANVELLQQTLRGDWGFRGLVMSDAFSITDCHQGHGYTRDEAESAAAALRAGCDVEIGRCYRSLTEALQRGIVDEADIDRSLTRVLSLRERLGVLGDTTAAPGEVDFDAHAALGRRAAVSSITLLKNDGILPLQREARLLVTGPLAADVPVLLGNYHGINPALTTVLEGIAGAVGHAAAVQYQPGCELHGDTRAGIAAARRVAAGVDVVIAAVGINSTLEGEEGAAMGSQANGDRADIELPAAQHELLAALHETGTPLVVVVGTGSALALGWAARHADAVLCMWYPGQAGGHAVADVLYGDANPAGRLPVTFYGATRDLPPFDDYRMAGRTYRYFGGEPVFPFGFGLSYSRFTYRGLELAEDAIAAGGRLSFSFEICNDSDIAGDEVIQIYFSAEDAGIDAPRCQLVAFERCRFAARESKRFERTIPAGELALVDADGNRAPRPGRYNLYVAASAPRRRARALGAPQLSAPFTIRE